VAAVADLKLHSSGKVREIYEWEDDLLMVASDRISIYDVVMPTPITDKGKVLNRISEFWFELTADIVPNHFVSADVPEEVAERAMRVRRLEMYPVECVVRGYLSGSAWVDYQATGGICDIRLQEGLTESARLPVPIFTPATKAATGHDENISFAEMASIVGAELAVWLRDTSLTLYLQAAEHARSRGILLADTKFEFGLIDGKPVLIDEVCTPDSSRFWSVDDYEPGRAQHSYDKQFVRDWLDASGWNRTPPGPELPADVVARTRRRYVQAYETLTGRSFDDWMA
jgi:phosphoribosylaminoimidazole-succinocarboxamide synthase